MPIVEATAAATNKGKVRISERQRIAEAAIDMIVVLEQQAISILQGPPFNHVIPDSHYVFLRFNQDQAVLEVVKPVIESDTAVFESSIYPFPARLLFMSAEELAEWISNEEQKVKMSDEEREERRLLAFLIEKYKDHDKKDTLEKYSGGKYD